MSARRRPVMDRYAGLSPEQRAAGALWSLVLAQSFGGFDVHGGVGADALGPLSDLEVSDVLHGELVRELADLAREADSTREGAMIAVEVDFTLDRPRRGSDDLDTLALCEHFRRTARLVDLLAYARYGRRARQLGLLDGAHGLPDGDLAALGGARLALDSVAAADDEPEHFKERLLYAVAEVVDRAVRLRLPIDAGDHARRVRANAMIAAHFHDHGLPVPSQPAID